MTTSCSEFISRIFPSCPSVVTTETFMIRSLACTRDNSLADGSSLGRLPDGLEGFHHFEHTVADFGVNLRKTNSHARAKRILVCFRADPCNETFRRQPF